MSNDQILIQSIYKEYCDAFSNKDIDGIIEILSADFQWKLLDGTVMDYANTCEAIELEMDTTASVEAMTIDVLSFEVSSDKAIVINKEHLSITKYGSDGNIEQFIIDEVYRDLWVMTSGGWKFLAAEVLESETKQISELAA